MKDENASEAYQNLLVLAQYRFPPKPSALFRVLRHVKTKDDLAIARKAFNVCQAKGTNLDSSISRAWARACLVAGDVDAAFEKFKDPAKTRMFFTVGALEEMLDSARRDKDGALLERVLGLVHATRKAQLLSGWRMAHKLMSTYASTGKVKEALAAYARLKDQRQLTMVALPTLIVLNSIAEASEPLADAELAIVRDAVLPIARRFPVLGSRIAAVRLDGLRGWRRDSRLHSCGAANDAFQDPRAACAPARVVPPMRCDGTDFRRLHCAVLFPCPRAATLCCSFVLLSAPHVCRVCLQVEAKLPQLTGATLSAATPAAEAAASPAAAEAAPAAAAPVASS
jgi:hypothetical protein